MIYIIIPTYNEKENISRLIKAIFDLKINDLRILVVDDNSPDGTAATVESLKNEYPVEVLKRPSKLGLGSAYIAGFGYALKKQADYIFQMDADFSHRPEDITRLLEAAEAGYDLVLGSRRVPGGKIEGWKGWRHFTSWGATTFSRLLLGLETKDSTTGFRCFSADLLRKIDWVQIKSNGYAFQEEVLYICEKTGCKIKEVPIIFIDRKLGKSKLGLKDIVEFFVRIINLKFKNGARVSKKIRV